MENLYFTIDDIKKIPSLSGVYRFYNKDRELIYIGKAKNLNSRINSYFSKNKKSLKVYNLVRNIAYISFTIVNSEHEAYLLENNLIKEFKPRYNVLLKDNKTYPYLVITNDEIPRIIVTETINNEYSYIFGPFSNRGFMNDLLGFIVKISKIRTCKYDLTRENIENKKYKVCLEYHIGNCCGICQNCVNFDQYRSIVDIAIDILKGNFKKVKVAIKDKMLKYSRIEQYKLAQRYKNALEELSSYESKSVISNPKLKDLDVFYVEKDGIELYCNYFIIKGGLLIFTKTDVFFNVGVCDVFRLYRDEYLSTSKNIISNVVFTYNNIISKVPRVGDKKKLIDVCKKNIDYFISELKIKKTLEFDKSQLLIDLKNELNLKNVPFHIECFDNSNLQGTNPVSSCVVFKNGEPSKEDYRKFKIRTVIGQDDFKSMEEVVFRRYKNIEIIPDLVVIDGGRGQLNSAVKVLKKLKIFKKMDVIALAKEFEEIYFYNSENVIRLDKNSRVLHLLQYIRDEAHRFAINFHRKCRSINFIQKSS